MIRDPLFPDMEILDARATTLTNYEALRFLKELKAAIGSKKQEKGKPKVKVNKSLLTVTLEAIKTLEDSPAGLQEEHHVREMALQLGDLCREQNINLTKYELVQLANLRPISAVDIQLLIENSEERLNDQQVEEVLRVVGETLPGPPEGEDEEVADESEGEGNAGAEEVNEEVVEGMNGGET